MEPLTTAIRSPRSNGMAEAFVKTFKRDCAERMDRSDAITVMRQLSAAFEHYNDFHTAALISYRTCWLISAKKPWAKEAAMCKAWVSNSYKKLTLLGHQVMGGLGFMEEADHQLYYRRARLADAMFGNADYQREIVAREMGL